MFLPGNNYKIALKMALREDINGALIWIVIVVVLAFTFLSKSTIQPAPANYVPVENLPCNTDKDCVGKSTLFPVMNCYKVSSQKTIDAYPNLKDKNICHVKFG